MFLTSREHVSTLSVTTAEWEGGKASPVPRKAFLFLSSFTSYFPFIITQPDSSYSALFICCASNLLTPPPPSRGTQVWSSPPHHFLLLLLLSVYCLQIEKVFFFSPLLHSSFFFFLFLSETPRIMSLKEGKKQNQRPGASRSKVLPNVCCRRECTFQRASPYRQTKWRRISGAPAQLRVNL